MKCTRLAAAAVLGGYVLASTLLSRAQPGSLDITFNPGTGANGSVNAMAVQPDGKVLLAGNFTRFNGTTRNAITRLNADGSLDTGFDPGDGLNLYAGSFASLALQSDGRVLVAGLFNGLDGVGLNSIARLRSDGSLDMSFNLVSGVANYPQFSCLALQTNGLVLVGGGGGGFSVTITGTNCHNIARLNSSGSLDTSFNPGTGASGAVNSIVLQADGRILIGGNFTSVNGTSCCGIARLNSDGGLDTNFTFVPFIGGASVNCIAVRTNGSILIGGSFGNINGYTRHSIARLNSDGTPDLSFQASVIPSGAEVHVLGLQPDGKILIAGWYFGYVSGVANAILVRLNSDGSCDSNFIPTSVTGSMGGSVTAAVLQQDGKLLIGGTFTQINLTNINYTARLSGDNPPTTNLQFLAANPYFGTYLQGTLSNTYRIEWTGNPNTASLWTPLFNVMLQTNPQFILDPNPASGRRFYRAVQVDP